jgi:hypothetical protein
VEPTAAARKVESLVTRNGRARPARSGSWLLDSTLPEDEPLAAHVVSIFKLTNADLAVWAELSTRFTVDLFVGLFLKTFNEGLELDPAVLNLLAERHVALGFDIYSD